MPITAQLPMASDAIFDRWTEELKFTTIDGTTVASRVRVAATFAARFKGLLGRSSLEAGEGMLLSPGDSIHTLGMHFAIDVLFMDRHLRVLQCVRSMQPWRLAFAPRGTRHVLELREGTIQAAAVQAGMRLLWSEVIAGRAAQ